MIETGHPCVQADHPKVYERSSNPAATRSEVGDRSRAITRRTSGPVTRFPVTDLFFRPLFAFFIVELKSRRVIPVGVSRSPSDLWVAQQLREATPSGHAAKYLIRENESKFGPCFARGAKTSSIKLLKTPVHTK